MEEVILLTIFLSPKPKSSLLPLSPPLVASSPPSSLRLARLSVYRHGENRSAEFDNRGCAEEACRIAGMHPMYAALLSAHIVKYFQNLTCSVGIFLVLSVSDPFWLEGLALMRYLSGKYGDASSAAVNIEACSRGLGAIDHILLGFFLKKCSFPEKCSPLSSSLNLFGV